MKSILKSILPRQILTVALKVKADIDSQLIKVFSKTRFTSSLYYLLFSTKFSREHQSVLLGRIAYQRSLSEVQSTSILLRRNIHRLEKALIMEPRKPVFAEDYIAETVDNYLLCNNRDGFCPHELKWATDVLNKFFEAVSDSKVIVLSREKFLSCTLNSSNNEIGGNNCYSPYESQSRLQSSITTEQLYRLYKQRRSTRWFEEKKVEQSTLEQAIELASLAPSACNRQPFYFYKTVNAEKAKAIAKFAMGTKGFSDNLQALVVLVGDLSAYPKEQDRHVIYIDGGLVAMQFMLACETLGLSSCPINWPDIENYERELQKGLKLDTYLRPIMMMAVGYAKNSGGIPYSQKKSAQQLIRDMD